MGLISGWHCTFGCLQRLVRVGVEELDVELVERVVYNIKRPGRGINDRSWGVKILKVWQMRKFKQDV